MKISLLSSGRRRECGSMLIVTALVAVVAGSTLAFFLLRSQQENIQINRSQDWNTAMVIAEAGLEEALALVNRNNNNPNAITNWIDGAVADGWTVSTLSSGIKVFSISRSLGADYGSYDVWITNSIGAPTIMSSGTAISRDSRMNVTTINRRILLAATSLASFPGAITVKEAVDMNGNNVTVDSYDSSDPLHSYWPGYPLGRGYGLYTNTESNPNTVRNANGNVATLGLIINVGNAQIYGHTDTAPGGTTSVGANGSVGGIAWVDADTRGIEPGYSADDMNMTLPDVSLPATNWTSFTGSTITNPGYYTRNNINNNFTIAATNVVLYLTNGIDLQGNNTFTIATNGSVTIYAGGAITLNGNGKINNATQLASRLIVYGLTNLTSITLTGNGAMWAAIYAPQADTSYKGSGSSGGYYGSLTAKSVLLTGNSSFSYDEALGKLNSNSGFVSQWWQEITP